jgi:high-affinity iron transporter
MRAVIILFMALMLLTKPLLADTRQLLQLIDYVGVDYGGAIENGQIINEAEYAEMLDFSVGITQQVADLPEHAIKPELINQTKTLRQWVQKKEQANKIKQLTAQMHNKITDAYQIIVVPRKQPDIERAKYLYTEQCASCHGTDGFGDGPAIGMDPPPINFHDLECYKQRSLYGLYNTITQGVNDTAMKAYDQLSDEDSWSLVFYVGSLAVQVTDADIIESPLLNIGKLTITTPDQAKTLYGENGAQVMAYLRQHPELLFDDETSLAFARERLGDVTTAYKNNNNRKKAYHYKERHSTSVF